MFEISHSESLSIIRDDLLPIGFHNILTFLNTTFIKLKHLKSMFGQSEMEPFL